MTDIENDLPIDEWLDQNWDADLPVEQWWDRLARAGLAAPTLAAPWGRGWSRAQTTKLAHAMIDRGALGPPSGLGMMLAAPTLLAHGSDELINTYVPKILDGKHGWCQLFSEPGAGSDLAGIQTRAERDGDEWVVSGQKVWTSMGQWADYGILMARTEPDAPKHRGISYFVFPMKQDGVEVRPLREMTGRSLFNEVFIDEARVPHDHVVGDLNDGWRVANTTLMFERNSIGGESISAPSAALPGSIGGHLDKPAGSFGEKISALSSGMVGPGRIKQLINHASDNDAATDPTIRQDLVKLHSSMMITRWHVGRMKSGSAKTGGEGSLAKLRNSHVTRMTRDISCEVLGPHAMITGDDSVSGGLFQEITMFSPAPSIYGGSDEVQRNIIGERALGLPKEPGPGRDTPFSELPKNG